MNLLEQLKSVLCDPTGKCCVQGSDEDREIVDRALQALAEQPAQQEPDWYHFVRHGDDCFVPYKGQAPANATALYTSPPAQRKPLTDEQIDAIGAKIFSADFLDVEEIHANRDIARAIEAAHGIKENT